ncbi:hypothetical protein CSA37_01335 [Candidatus Fermentibacteria bacterium]|nr:MAG: hypothetical protein CSA37_01335 [Candidatus Fermentibacteria bacterium]
MFFRISVAAVAASMILLAGCGNHPASDSIKAFTIALADSSWTEAWELMTPETQAAWDSTAVVMQRFGYTECSGYLQSLSVPVTEEEFAELTGELLFTRMVQSSSEASELSCAVREVETVDSLTVLVRIATSEGDQIIPARLHSGRWLLDLTTLTPPPEPLLE